MQISARHCGRHIVDTVIPRGGAIGVVPFHSVLHFRFLRDSLRVA